MKPNKLVLFVLALFVSLSALAKEEYYGNIKLRSIGVGNMPQTEYVRHNVSVGGATNSQYYHSYGVRTEGSQGYVVSAPTNYTELRVNSTMSKDSKPFENDVVATSNSMYAFPSNPKDPGAPIGDALPFVALLAAVYVFIRNKE